MLGDPYRVTPTYPGAAPPILPKTKSAGSHHHQAPDFYVFSGSIHACGPPYPSGALHVGSPHMSARLSPYAGAVPSYVSTAPSCNHQAPKIPTLVSTRPAFPAPQIKHPQVSTNFLRSIWRSTTCVVMSVPTPDETSDGLLKPTHPASSRKFLVLAGGLGVSVNVSDDVGDDREEGCPAFSARLKAGPEAAARLEAGNCGEVFVRLFHVCAALPHQVCADGSAFFCRQLSKAGLSESIHHIPVVGNVLPDKFQIVRIPRGKY